MTSIHFELDADGIALLSIDVPGQSMNVITPQFQDDLEALTAKISSDPAIKGAVITSAKSSGFMAGADLKGMAALFGGDMTPAGVFAAAFRLNRSYRALETCGKPVVAAVNGLALGGGLELVLACHHRLVVDDDRIKLGLPEVMIGLLPGGGGTQRLPRLVGVQPALPLLLQGKTLSPKEAMGMGIVQGVVAADDLIATAKAWAKANPAARQPWDDKKFRIPGGAGWANANFVQTMAGAVAMTLGVTQGNYNAPQAILSCVYEGCQLAIDHAIKVESKYFTKLLTSPQAQAMIRSLFVNKQAAERGARRPEGVEKSPTQKLAMLGAGLMGAGITYVSAKAGIEVILLDRDLVAAEKGKEYSRKIVEKDVKRGRTTKEAGEALLARITPTDDFNALNGCDLVIEAVFESPEIKADVTKKTEAVLGKNVIFGSNTSTLPITLLAKAWSKADNFVGIHFFSPVEKMPLVEIIMGKKTGKAAVAKALDYVAQIKKTPIVVNDSRGFYTSRSFGTYVMEGYAMVGEGVNPALIDNCGVQAGMPVGPLAVGDEVAIDLSYKIMTATRTALGEKYPVNPGDKVVEHMYGLGRYGRKNAKGFYVYPEDGAKKYLWPEMAKEFPRSATQPDPAEVKTRLVYRQLVECARCYGEGVLETVEDGDLGAIFGWGFLPFSGGPFSYMDQLGIANVVRELNRLAKAYGPRFAPPKILKDMAKNRETFYARAGKQAA